MRLSGAFAGPQGHSPLRGAASGWGYTLLRASLKLLVAFCFAFFNYYIIDWLNDSFYTTFAPIYDNWGLKYPYAGDLGVTSLDAYDNSLMLFLWVPTLTAGLATLLLRSVPQGTVPRAYMAVRRRVGRVLAWQAPPRRFWAWWCDGMTVIDMMVLALLLALNAWYFAHYYIIYERWLDAIAETGLPYPEPRWRLMLEKVALIFGIMLWPNIWFLFFPIPQSSFLQWFTGLNYSQMIRYHRWIGHITMWVLTLHGWLYYIYWALTGDFWHYFSDWSTLSSINFLAGTIAYVFGLVLWATAVGWVRRRFFEVFYRCHLVCFVGFTLFAYIHYFWVWSMFLPGLLLYSIDLSLRAGQLSGTTLVTAASVDAKSGVATVQLQTSETMKGCPVHELFLLVPKISRWQWHPITVAGTADNGKGAGSTLTLNIKRYGKWTKDLMDLLSRPDPLAVRLSAPEGPPLPSWADHGAVVLVGGGIGVTPLLAMLRDVMAKRRADPSAVASLPSRVHLVWAAREAHEFAILDSDILNAARSADGWLTVELRCTGKMEDEMSRSSPSKGSDKDQLPSCDSARKVARTDSSESSHNVHPTGPACPGLSASSASRCPLSSPLFHKHARVIQSQHAGMLHLALVYVLAFVGTYLGTYLGGAYMGESYTAFDSAGISPYPNSFYWKVGMVWFFTQAITSIGVPFILAVLPLHIWRYWRATTKEQSSELLPLLPPGPPTGHGSGCILSGSTLTASAGEEGLEITAGRPDVRATLEAAASVAGDGGSVGVFVGGPEPMTRQVQLEVAAANGRRGASSHFAFHAMAHSL